MANLQEAAIPLDTAASEGSLAVRLVFKMLAMLRESGTIDDETLETVAEGLIAELGSEQERAAQWRMLEDWLPKFLRDGETTPR